MPSNPADLQVQPAGKPLRRRTKLSSYWALPGVAEHLYPGESIAAMDQWVDRLLRGDVRVARTLKVDRSSRVDHIEGDLVVKRVYRGAWRTRIGRWSRTTPAWREWRRAHRLVEAGIRCNPPLALIEGLEAGTQVLVYRLIHGRSLDYYLDELASVQAEQWSVAQRDNRLRVAAAIGGQFGRLLRHGLVNRDHKPGNLIIDQACEQLGEEPVLIDPVGVETYRKAAQAYRSLAILRWELWLFGEATPRELVEAGRALTEAYPSLVGTGGGAVRRLRGQVEPLLRPRPEPIGPPNPPQER